LLVLLTALSLGALPGHAQESVQVRGWAKATYGRIIFDWPKPVKASARIEGAALVVDFSRPMRSDLNRVVKYLGGYVTNAELAEGGKTARFGLAGNFDVDSFATGSSVVVDLRRKTAAVAPPREAAANDGGLKVKVGRHPGFTRIVFDWPSNVGYTIARKGRSVSMRFDKSAKIDLHELDAALPKPEFGSPTASEAGGDLVVNLVVPETTYIRHFREGTKVILDVQEEGADFGNMLVGASNGPTMETIAPNGDVVVVPAMVGSHVAVASEGEIPLITEDAGDAGSVQARHSPLTHYDPNASGLPRNLLLYDLKLPRKPLNGG
jgi:hypothetical protein